MSAVKMYEHADENAILFVVSAVDDAKDVDRRFTHHLEAVAEPGLPRAGPGYDQTLIGAAVKGTTFPVAPQGVGQGHNLDDEFRNRLRGEARIVFGRFDGGVAGAVGTGMFFHDGALAPHSTAGDCDPSPANGAENGYRCPNLGHAER